MSYMLRGYMGGSCASSSGFGCSPFDDFFLDDSKVAYANTLYQDRYKRPIPERVAALLRDRSDYCDRSSIGRFVDRHPPTSTDKTAGEVLEEQQAGGGSPTPTNLNLPPPPASDSSGGLPKWVIPAAAAGVGLLAVVLVMKKKRKA